MEKNFIDVLAIGFFITLISAILMILTQRFHGKHTLDHDNGVQKFHDRPTARIGGVTIAAGYIAVWFFTTGEVRTLWLLIGLSGLPAFLFGLGEDLTGKVGVRARLLASIASGVVFCLSTGYTVTESSIDVINYILSFPFVSLAFSALALGGMTNAINMIDGFHGLASGTVILILAAIALVALRVGDDTMVTLSVAMAAITAGFFLVNFPFGKIFLGDAGAYYCGFVIAAPAIMLPARNPEVSPWVSLLIVGYPVTETLFSIFRRLLKKGQHPGAADSGHLHHMIYKNWAMPAAEKLGVRALANPLTGILSWSMPLIALVSVNFVDLRARNSVIVLTLSVLIYLILYRLFSSTEAGTIRSGAPPKKE